MIFSAVIDADFLFGAILLAGAPVDVPYCGFYRRFLLGHEFDLCGLSRLLAEKSLLVRILILSHVF